MLTENTVIAQTNEEKIIEQKAFYFYQQKKYSEALPLFSQLLSLYPKDERYNLHYAACLIETNQLIDKSVKYLQFADSKSNDPMIKYYLGRAYHLGYQFKEAIENYNAFIQLVPQKLVKELNVNKLIEMCQSGLDLIKYISDLTVVDNRRIKSENYFYSYDLKEFNGKLVIKPKELKSSVDKKEEPANMVIFLPNNSNIIYYGSYGANKSNGRDIYRMERLVDGKWGKSENLGYIINTPFDDDFPFLHPDGKTLYFSSKGHNSMGGYDIFKSEFDSVTMSWSKPLNLDFPINTPYDDYLYITDKDNFYAYFTSNRETRDNNITVYKILVDKNPIKREYKDIEEIINVSKLEVSSLAEIKKAEEAKQKNKANDQELIFATNDNYKNNINISSYHFKPITYKPTLTSQEVVNNLKSDNEKIEKNANEIRRQSQMAYIVAKQNNEKANQKRKEAYEKNATIKNITDPVEAEQKKQEIYQLINEAEEYERQAITAYNIAQNFEEIAAEMSKDIAKSQSFINAMEKQGVVDEAIVDAANKNKERLELSQNKYSSLQKKFEDRKNLQKSKENELFAYEEMLNNTIDSINEIENQLKVIESKINESNSDVEKNHLTLQSEALNNRSDILEAKQLEIAELIEKAKIDIENLNSENQFLKQFAEKVENDNRTYEELSKEPVLKDQLKKDIFEKELSADIAVAQTVKEKVGQKNISKNNQANKTIAQKNSNNNIETTNKIVTSDTLQKTQSTIASNQENTNTLIKGVNPLLPNTTVTNTASAENIEKEQFNVQYYTTVLNEQQQKLEIINNALNKAKDKKEKQLLEQQKNFLVEEIQNNKQALSQSQNKLSEYKNTLANKLDTSINTSNEELVLKASKYDNKYVINFSLAQKKQLEQAEQDKQNIKKLKEQIKNNAAEIKRLELLRISLNNNTEQKNAENQIAELTNQQNQLFRDYSNKIDKNNQNTANIYNQVLSTVRNYDAENQSVKTASLVEKEIQALNEKSSQLKKEALLLNDMNEKINRYNKADIIDQIAIEKQKYAIDLYVSSRQKIAQATNNSQYKNKESSQTENTKNIVKSVSVELSPEENKQISEYQTQKAKAETKLTQGKSLCQEIEEKRQLAAKTYSTAKKKEILKDIDKKEQAAVALVMDAHSIYEQANNKKYEVYQNKIKQLLDNSNVLEDNKSIAIQFLKEADLYYGEAQQVRQKSKAAATNDDKIKLLNKALALEQKALSNQEYALDAMTNTEPVEFIATNNLTKIDRLEALDKPINVEDVIRIKTERIISNLSLSEAEKTKLDEALAKQQTISQLITEAEKYEVKLNLAKEISKNSTNKNEKKKAEKSIPKLEKEYFGRKFTAAELTENVNDAYYNLYETKFMDIRPKDKSEEEKQGKQLEKNANKKYIQAKQLREKSFITENPYLAFNYLLQADSIEKSAIEDQEKAFGLYLKLKPLDDELKEYAEKHPKKQSIDDLIVIKTTADITPITKEELAQIEENQVNKNYKQIENINYAQTEVANNQTDNTVTKVKNTQTGVVNNLTDDTNQQLNNAQTEVVNNQTDNTDTKVKNTKTEVIKNLTEDTNQNLSNAKTELANNQKEINNTTAENKTEKNLIVSSESNSIIPSNVTTPMGFSLMPHSPYSDANPIPINPPLPNGLVFKVQIGAFNKPVKTDVFKGLSPVSAEKLEGSKFYRYFVGMFYSESAAIMVRDYVRPMGYNDAFVVAFYNGKRITLFEARQIIKQAITPDYEKIIQEESSKISVVTSVKPNLIAHNNKAVITTNYENNQVSIIGETINETKELFYTVQIGVFKTPVSHQALKNLTPLYEDHAYNFIRYLVGKFSNRKDAEAEKNKIAALGITDAFVSAYYKGQKIALAEAATIEAMNPNAVITKSEKVNMSQVNATNTVDANSSVINVDINNLYYRVQIGSFKEKVPFNIAAKFVQISGQYAIDQQVEDGTTVYYAGKFKSYNEAVQCKNSIANQGFPDAFIVASDGKQRVPVNQAKELLRQ